MNISFVIPAYNEELHIAKCLSSIINLAKANNINAEIIVIDNGSTDQTKSIALEYHCKVFSVSKNVVSVARNIGQEKATNELIAFIDGDVELTTEWFQNIRTRFKSMIESPYFLTGSPCSIPPNPSKIEKFWFGNLKDFHLGGANMITTKSAFNKIGGFDVDLETGEDYDFCLKAIAQKVDYKHDQKFIAYHWGFPKTLKDFFNREKWHGKGDSGSLKAILNSSVSIISIVQTLLLSLSLISLLAGKPINFAMLLFCYILINAAITLKRFGNLPPKHFFYCFSLNAIYFCARFFSIVSK